MPFPNAQMPFPYDQQDDPHTPHAAPRPHQDNTDEKTDHEPGDSEDDEQNGEYDETSEYEGSEAQRLLFRMQEAAGHGAADDYATPTTCDCDDQTRQFVLCQTLSPRALCIDCHRAVPMNRGADDSVRMRCGHEICVDCMQNVDQAINERYDSYINGQEDQNQAVTGLPCCHLCPAIAKLKVATAEEMCQTCDDPLCPESPPPNQPTARATTPPTGRRSSTKRLTDRYDSDEDDNPCPASILDSDGGSDGEDEQNRQRRRGRKSTRGDPPPEPPPPSIPPSPSGSEGQQDETFGSPPTSSTPRPTTTTRWLQRYGQNRS